MEHRVIIRGLEEVQWFSVLVLTKLRLSYPQQDVDYCARLLVDIVDHMVKSVLSAECYLFGDAILLSFLLSNDCEALRYIGDKAVLCRLLEHGDCIGPLIVFEQVRYRLFARLTELLIFCAEVCFFYL